MIITKKLIYLQLQKTGSTHIANVLNKLFKCDRLTKHERLPKSYHTKDKLIIGSIRNPWDWYISLWAYGCQNKGGLYERVTSKSITGNYLLLYPVKTIVATTNEIIKPIKKWKSFYNDPSNPSLFRNWIKLIFDTNRRYDLKEKFGFSPICKHSGLLTYRYLYLYCENLPFIYQKKYAGSLNKLLEFDRENNILDAIIHTENLENDLIEILKEAGYIVDKKMIEEINSLDKSNTSRRKRKIKYYYDEKTKILIEKNEKLIINKYSYEFPK